MRRLSDINALAVYTVGFTHRNTHGGFAGMSTSTILRQCMHELDAALEAAEREHGEDSAQARLIADAVTWMRDWMRHYAQYIRNE